MAVTLGAVRSLYAFDLGLADTGLLLPMPMPCHATHQAAMAHATVTFPLRHEMAVVRARGRHSSSGGRDWPVKSDHPQQGNPSCTYMHNPRGESKRESQLSPSCAQGHCKNHFSKFDKAESWLPSARQDGAMGSPANY